MAGLVDIIVVAGLDIKLGTGTTSEDKVDTLGDIMLETIDSETELGTDKVSDTILGPLGIEKLIASDDTGKVIVG